MANTKSLDFEASSSQSATRSDSASLSFTGSFTLEFWVRFESLPGSGDSFSFFEQWNTSGQRSKVIGWNNDAGTHKMFISTSSDGNSGGSITTGQVTLATPSLDTWYHYGVVYDATAGEAKVFRAAECGTHAQEGSTLTGLNTSIHNSTANITMFSPGVNFTTYYDGLIDEYRAWSATKSAADLDAAMNEELVGDETNLQGYWKFNDDANDSTANGNTLTLVNSPAYSETLPNWSCAVGPTNLKTYNTNVKANIKTINTNPIANVKSLNTNV